jgi:hypothetical protein
MYVLSVQYICAVVSFFLVVAGLVLKMRIRFYKINPIGLLYYDPIADVSIYKTYHSFALYLSLLYISLAPHRFAS